MRVGFKGKEQGVGDGEEIDSDRGVRSDGVLAGVGVELRVAASVLEVWRGVLWRLMHLRAERSFAKLQLTLEQLATTESVVLHQHDLCLHQLGAERRDVQRP